LEVVWQEHLHGNVKKVNLNLAVLNAKGRASYNRSTGGNLRPPVTTKPSRLKKGSSAYNRRKSFCSRMQGMKRRLTSAKTANDPNSRINKALRKWNC
jgi:hypothetical protein